MSMQEVVQQLSEQAERDAVEKMQDQLIKMNAALYSSAMAYTNVIVIAGYAAIFTVWNFTKEQLSPFMTQLIAILLLVSIGVFVGFEIYKMIRNGVRAFTLQSLIKPQMHYREIQRRIAEHQRQEQRQAVWLGRVWIPVLVITIGTGYGAGALLAYSFLKNLLA